jgi:hypothetical protein
MLQPMSVPELISERMIVDLLEEAPGRLRWKAYMESYVPEATPWTKDFLPKRCPALFRQAQSVFVLLFDRAQSGAVEAHRKRGGAVRRPAQWRVSRIRLVDAEYLERWPLDRRDVKGPQPKSARPCRPVGALARALLGAIALSRPAVAPAAAYPGGSHFRRIRLRRTLQARACFDVRRTQSGLHRSRDGIEPGFEEEGYNAYSLPRTIEVNFGLDHLHKNDAGANWFQFLWGRRFEWSGPQPTPFEHFDGPLAAAGFADALFVACAAADGTIRIRTRSAEYQRWSAEEALAINGSGGIAMASTFSELVLVARSAESRLACMKYDCSMDGQPRPHPRRRSSPRSLWPHLPTRKRSCWPSVMPREP